MSRTVHEDEWPANKNLVCTPNHHALPLEFAAERVRDAADSRCSGFFNALSLSDEGAVRAAGLDVHQRRPGTLIKVDKVVATVLADDGKVRAIAGVLDDADEVAATALLFDRRVVAVPRLRDQCGVLRIRAITAGIGDRHCTVDFADDRVGRQRGDVAKIDGRIKISGEAAGGRRGGQYCDQSLQEHFHRRSLATAAFKKIPLASRMG